MERGLAVETERGASASGCKPIMLQPSTNADATAAGSSIAPTWRCWRRRARCAASPCAPWTSSWTSCASRTRRPRRRSTASSRIWRLASRTSSSSSTRSSSPSARGRRGARPLLRGSFGRRGRAGTPVMHRFLDAAVGTPKKRAQPHVLHKAYYLRFITIVQVDWLLYRLQLLRLCTILKQAFRLVCIKFRLRAYYQPRYTIREHKRRTRARRPYRCRLNPTTCITKKATASTA